MQLDPGTRVGAYEVVGVLGAGGMGEVYRAHDALLNRDVALKILPSSVALDPERVTRFKREAQVLASLNHPHIAIIHGFEQANGIHALVMELVDGPTLADRLAEGPLPLDEALRIAKHLAEAVEAAHEQGVIHRDLKPANIKLRPDGTVKVLDFGLAKVIEPAPAMSLGLSDSPTLTTPAMTEAGVILGTAAYMSPEQAKGHPADKRSDIWAFGCIVFEMLSGRRAFLGRTVSETLGNVLHTEPNWQALPVQTPPQIRSLLRRSLAKDVHQREPHIGSARLEIEEVLEAPSSRQPVHRASRARPRTVIATLIALSVLLVATVTVLLYERAALLNSRSNHDGRRYQSSLPLPDGVTFASGTVPSWRMRLSPDGTRLAFAASGP